MASNATTENGKQVGDVQAAIDLALRLGNVEIVDIGGVKAASVPSHNGGRELKSIKALTDEYLKAPERRKGTATMTSLDSFIDHVNRHKDDHAVLFAVDRKDAPSMLAVYDYNESGAKGAPRFGTHRASYSFPLSDEWAAWMAASRAEAMSQSDFAEFLEDRIGDVLNPASPEIGDTITEFKMNLGIELASAQQLMTLSRGLKVHVNARVSNALNLSSGEAQVMFEEVHQGEGGATLKIPGGFALAIPVFRLGARWQIPVKLRYRVKGPNVFWTVALHNTDKVFKTAFEEAVKQASDHTKLPVFFGTPEV